VPVVAGPEYKSFFFKKDSVPCPSASPGGIVQWDSVLYSSPSFNPENAAELLYIRYTEGRNEYRLDKVNLKTGAKAIVYSTNQDIISSCAWGRGGRILFCEAGNLTAVPHYDLYQIQSDGSGKTRITQGQEAYTVSWNFDQSQYIYSALYNHESYVADGSTNQVRDTFPRLFTSYDSWAHPYFVAFPDSMGLRIYDMVIDSAYAIQEATWPATGVRNACTWLNDYQTLVYAQHDGIYSVNTSNNKKLQLASSCPQREYKAVSYAPLSRKLVWQRLEYTKEGSNTRGRSQLIMMNMNGEDRQVMVLP